MTARPNVSTDLTADPIKQLINTHWHFDRTSGSEWFCVLAVTTAALDASVIYENKRKEQNEDHDSECQPEGRD